MLPRVTHEAIKTSTTTTTWQGSVCSTQSCLQEVRANSTGIIHPRERVQGLNSTSMKQAPVSKSRPRNKLTFPASSSISVSELWCYHLDCRESGKQQKEVTLPLWVLSLTCDPNQALEEDNFWVDFEIQKFLGLISRVCFFFWNSLCECSKYEKNKWEELFRKNSWSKHVKFI